MNITIAACPRGQAALVMSTAFFPDHSRRAQQAEGREPGQKPPDQGAVSGDGGGRFVKSWVCNQRVLVARTVFPDQLINIDGLLLRYGGGHLDGAVSLQIHLGFAAFVLLCYGGLEILLLAYFYLVHKSCIYN